MHSLRLQSIQKNFGDFKALDHVDLEIPEQTCVAFLGPSGCGKTTLLRIIAGLTQPDAGRVLIADRDVTPLPPSQRGIGMVFQSLALFPHLSVADNITYAQRIRGVGEGERRRRARELLDLVRLPGVEDRHIKQLSGGQRQRVAIARALAVNPSLLLLDEPLSALDAKLREEMQIELRQLQQKLRITTIIVTHDRREAMTMSDLIVVMGQGQIQQIGKPIDIYRRPANSFVADFIGATNIFPVTITQPGQVKLGDYMLRAESRDVQAGSSALISIRPESIRLHPSMALSQDLLPGRITFVRDLGADLEAHIDLGSHRLVAQVSSRYRDVIHANIAVGVEIPPEDVVVMKK